MVIQVIEVHNTVRTPSVGSCIYCGEVDGLSDEHVIPYALGGLFVLSESTCNKCAAITSEFERKVLRGFMLDARVAGGFPTRRPKERPASLQLDIESNGIFKEVELSPEEHPGLLLLPMLLPAGILVGREPSTGVSVCGIETIYFGRNPLAVAADLDVKEISKTCDLDVTSFSRLIAKIAYGFAVAHFGLLPRDNVPILPLILGTSDDASMWLGSADFRLTVEGKNLIHAVATTCVPDPRDALRQLIIAQVKFFVQSGATGYEVVVCCK